MLEQELPQLAHLSREEGQPAAQAASAWEKHSRGSESSRAEQGKQMIGQFGEPEQVSAQNIPGF